MPVTAAPAPTPAHTDTHTHTRTSTAAPPFRDVDGTSGAPRERAPGRFCPADYAIGAPAFAALAELSPQVLYVVGGLYGNTCALAKLQTLLDAERALGREVQAVFNGDFHWFDRDPEQFARVEAGVAPFVALRGNVETELARDSGQAGCGCAYPDEVDDGEVERSNRIIGSLRQTARTHGVTERLRALPMIARARVGELRVGITHGDDRSLAGWRFAHDRVDAQRASIRAACADAEVDLFASSHTCLPVATIECTGDQWHGVVNNGAAGMPNFGGSNFGLVTRIALGGLELPAQHSVIYRAAALGASVEAVALRFDHHSWLERFLRQWPAGTAAHRSYFGRICGEVGYSVAQAVRGGFEAQGVTV